MTRAIRWGKPGKVALVLGLAALVGVVALTVGHGSANASSTAAVARSAEVTWTQPSGPQMTPESAARTALEDTGGQGAPSQAQTVTVRVAHGAYGPLRAVLEGPEAGPMHRGAARCLPDAPANAPCNLAEVEHWEKIEREMSESPAYMVEMTAASSFSLPGDLVRHGHSAGGGEIETVILDAQTGFMRSREIGSRAIDMSGLGAISVYEAGLSPSDAHAATSAKVMFLRQRRAPARGRIAGRLVGADVAGKLVRLFNRVGGAKRPGDIGVLRKTRSGPHGEFSVSSLMAREYTIQVQGCKGGPLRVRAAKTTHVTLRCSH